MENDLASENDAVSTATALGSISTRATLTGFLKAVSVYINKPHVVNRRLCGAKIWRIDQTSTDCLISDIHRQFATAYAGKIICNEHEDENFLDVDLALEDSSFRTVVIRDLVPKNVEKQPTLREMIIYDPTTWQVLFYPLSYVKKSEVDESDISDNLTKEKTYCFQYTNKDIIRIHLKLMDSSSIEAEGHVTTKWLSEVLLQKLVRWAEEEQLRIGTTSLKLVAIDEYNLLYNSLKQKYGYEFVKSWPEKTDPQKFVFEDVAIAAYLLLLWKEDRERRGMERLQSFVDLGCGNGLLVHILASEGHPGFGIDIRRRSIWDYYGNTTVLKEESITPSADSLFPDSDWIIGNHSDELTPWIPVMTARSSYTCNYFVLPCCHHDFDSKFNKRERGTSQYRTYLNFVKEVGEVCGFEVEEDTLRIPSTKRVCFVGRTRSYCPSEEKSMDAKRTAYINSRCVKTNNDQGQIDGQSSKVILSDEKQETHAEKDEIITKRRLSDNQNTGNQNGGTSSGPHDQKSDQWSSSFQPRSSTEAVRNCQCVDKETKEMIVRSVFQNVLAAEDADVVKLEDGRTWKRGGSLPLSAVAGLFNQTVLQKLKSECGGIQTLLRNHNIFQVSGGKVQLRDFSIQDPWPQRAKSKVRKVDTGDYFKTVICWFHANHPDGCPRQSTQCSFAHGQEELRPRPQKSTSKH